VKVGGDRPAGNLSQVGTFGVTLNRMASRNRSRETAYDEDDDEKPKGTALGSRRRFEEFECPSCSAHNPLDDGFGNNDEVLCNWCGVEFKALVNDEGVLRLKET
jgi:hypothetical protein